MSFRPFTDEDAAGIRSVATTQGWPAHDEVLRLLNTWEQLHEEHALLVKAVQAIVGACLIKVWPDGLVVAFDYTDGGELDTLEVLPDDQAAALGRAIEA